MPIYPTEEDGVKGFTKVLKAKPEQDPEEMRLKMDDDEAFEVWLKNRKVKKQQEKPIESLTEDISLLDALSRRTKALANLEDSTRKAREELAVNLLIKGEDAQKIFEACQIPNPANLITWVSNRGSEVPEEVRAAASKVKTPKQLEKDTA